MRPLAPEQQSTSDAFAAAVREQLEKMLASGSFSGSERLSRFLRYTVEEGLQGRGELLKESLLGVEVFGRKPTYDPRIDGVVRSEAVKLRQKLKEYYETEGCEDAVLIDLPKGRYVPSFQKRPAPSPPPAAEIKPVAPATRRGFPALLVSVLVLLSVAILYWTVKKPVVTARGPAVAEPASIAVLPFTDLSAEQDQEYFCDGMTDELIDALTKVGGFRVVARTSAFAFKGKQQDIREIGERLSVRTVLEGSVRKSGNKLRVTAQLIDVKNGYHLWSETYERELKDVFTVQDEISRAIVSTLQVKLASERTGGFVRAGTDDLEAYNLYLKARFYYGKWRPDSVSKSIEYYGQAIARDPKYAMAYASMADSYTWLSFYGVMAPKDAMPRARSAAEKALSLDPTLAAAHTSLGFVKALYDWDWAGSEREYKQAIELNPGFEGAHFGYAMTYLVPMGRMEEAETEMQRARELDPLSLVNSTFTGVNYFLSHQYDRAIEQYRRTLELDPNFLEPHGSLVSAYVEKGMFREAFAEIDRIRALAPDAHLDLTLAYAYAMQGKRDEAIRTLGARGEPGWRSYLRSSSIASVFAALGEKDRAFLYLDTAYGERDGLLPYLKCWPGFSRLRGDPRFAALVKKIGLPH